MPRDPDRLSVLVVDDEAPARLRIVDLLRQNASVARVLEATDGVSAVDAIRTDTPDLVFLDIQMPECSGLDVVASVGAEAMPLIVFVTAFDQHAVHAFEAGALDYLLKPFSDERFEATMERSCTRLRERDMRAFGRAALQAMKAAAPATPALDRLVVRDRERLRVVRVAEIDRIEAAGVYVNLHVGVRTLLHRATLNDLMANLDPRHFVRVHRSTVVNVDRIVSLEPVSHGEFDAVLADGSRCRVSRTYRAGLERRFGQPL